MWTIIIRVIPLVVIAVNIIEQIAALEGNLTSQSKKELAMDALKQLSKALFNYEIPENYIELLGKVIDTVVFLLNKIGWFHKPKETDIDYEDNNLP